MSDLIKAQATPQFNWLDFSRANEMPDKLIKEGLKQPDQYVLPTEQELIPEY
jgi:hypothetical protein